MKFLWATLRVQNLENSVKFYKEVVGLTENRRFQAGPGVEIVFLGEEGTEIELMSMPQSNEKSNISSENINSSKDKVSNNSFDISLGFEVNSVDEKIEELKAQGVEIHGGPFQPNPHVKFFYVLDPDGLKIQFVENM